MASNRRVCVNHAENFCYICGQYTPKQQCRNITKCIQLACKYYFDCKLRRPRQGMGTTCMLCLLQLNAIMLDEW